MAKADTNIMCSVFSIFCQQYFYEYRTYVSLFNFDTGFKLISIWHCLIWASNFKNIQSDLLACKLSY